MVNTANKPTIDMFRDIKILKCFNESELSELCTLGGTVVHEPHSNIIIEGELSWGLYLILDGIVGIFKTNKMSGDVYDIGHLRSGTYFGEMSLVDENPRSATIRALTETQLYFLSKDSFLQFLNQNNDRQVRFYQSCIKDLVGRLRDLGDDYVISQYQLWRTVFNKGGKAA